MNETETSGNDIAEPDEPVDAAEPQSQSASRQTDDLAARPAVDWLDTVERELDDTNVILRHLDGDRDKLRAAAQGLDTRVGEITLGRLGQD